MTHMNLSLHALTVDVTDLLSPLLHRNPRLKHRLRPLNTHPPRPFRADHTPNVSLNHKDLAARPSDGVGDTEDDLREGHFGHGREGW